MDGVESADPREGRLDTRIVRLETGVDHAFEAGIRHAAVRPQAAVGRQTGLRRPAGCGRVVESAVVDLGGKRGVVVFGFEVLGT